MDGRKDGSPSSDPCFIYHQILVLNTNNVFLPTINILQTGILFLNDYYSVDLIFDQFCSMKIHRKEIFLDCKSLLIDLLQRPADVKEYLPAVTRHPCIFNQSQKSQLEIIEIDGSLNQKSCLKKRKYI
ncbi:hypothetical protein ILYODFUR_028823 [Ilyodon furcidens]|uniref:Uncharacterized protein n=1 Tax=Ilyodon furcidens TaxID=33524 RepID=A0ABV0TRN7_9TELE